MCRMCQNILNVENIEKKKIEGWTVLQKCLIFAIGNILKFHLLKNFILVNFYLLNMYSKQIWIFVSC